MCTITNAHIQTKKSSESTSACTFTGCSRRALVKQPMAALQVKRGVRTLSRLFQRRRPPEGQWMDNAMSSRVVLRLELQLLELQDSSRDLKRSLQSK